MRNIKRVIARLGLAIAMTGTLLSGVSDAHADSAQGRAVSTLAPRETSGCILHTTSPSWFGPEWRTSAQCNGLTWSGPIWFRTWQATYTPWHTVTWQYGGWHHIGDGSWSTTSLGWGTVIATGVDKA